MELSENKTFNELIEVLEELSKLYGVLFDILQKEKSHLIKAELGPLVDNNKTKEALLFKIRGLDRLREKKAKAFAQLVESDVENPRLLEIAKKAPKAQAERLRNIHSTLSMQIERVQETNQENETYTQSALKVLGGALNDIKQTVMIKPTYGKKGMMAGSTETKSGNFVSKEA